MIPFVDLVIGGPDMSGTSTQVNDIIEFFKSRGKAVRDLRGTEIEALFHAVMFSEYNDDYLSLSEFLDDPKVLESSKMKFIFEANQLLMRGGSSKEDLKVASFVRNDVSVYINPDSADVWILEEPTRRGAGQVNRTIEQLRTRYGGNLHPFAAALSHQAYRTDEFLRFRKVLRDRGKIIIRSRSEESACYQISDPEHLPGGISRVQYLGLPGHEIAFANPPTHLFIVCAPSDWTAEGYLELKKERSSGRNLDDYEANAEYQLLVNRRYATDWLENLYREGCGMHGAGIPKIIRFNIYNSKEEIRRKIFNELNNIY